MYLCTLTEGSHPQQPHQVCSLFWTSACCTVCVCVAMDGPWVILPFSIWHTLPLSVADEVISWLNGRSSHDFGVKSTSFTHCWRLCSQTFTLSVKVYINGLANRNWYFISVTMRTGDGFGKLILFSFKKVFFQLYTLLLLPTSRVQIPTDFCACGSLKMCIVYS